MSTSKNKLDLINFIPFDHSNDIKQWNRDAEKLITSLLKSLNELSPHEFWNKFNLNSDIQQFFRSYLDTTHRCYEKTFFNNNNNNELQLLTEQKIYCLVYELLLKLFQIINCIGLKPAKNNPTFFNYIANIFDIATCVNISTLYFQSSAMNKALNLYMKTFHVFLKPLKDDYINAFYDVLFDEENTYFNTTSKLNDLIHTLTCVSNVLAELHKDLVTDTTIIKLITLVSSNENIYMQSNINKENLNDEFKLMEKRLSHLIFLYISQNETSTNCSHSIQIIFDTIQHYPDIILPLKYIYKIEQKIKFKELLNPDDYIYVMTCLINCSMHAELILPHSLNQFVPNDKKSDSETENSIKKLMELFPMLSMDTLNKCYSSKCDNDISKTIDFIFLHGAEEINLENILSDNQINSPELNTKFSSAFTTTNSSYVVLNEKDSMKKLTLNLVRTQHDEQERISNKIQQLAERYSLTPTMAASLLNLGIDQYEDENDDEDFENDANFQYVKGLMNKTKKKNLPDEMNFDYKTSISSDSAPVVNNNYSKNIQNRGKKLSPTKNKVNESPSISESSNQKKPKNQNKKPNYNKKRSDLQNKNRKTS